MFLGKISRTTVENQQANKMLGNIGKLTAQVYLLSNYIKQKVFAHNLLPSEEYDYYCEALQ
jgi:hypothetical protein